MCWGGLIVPLKQYFIIFFSDITEGVFSLKIHHNNFSEVKSSCQPDEKFSILLPFTGSENLVKKHCKKNVIAPIAFNGKITFRYISHSVL